MSIHLRQSSISEQFKLGQICITKLKAEAGVTKNISIIGIGKGDYENYLQKGISYLQYKQQMAANLALNADQKIKEYINLNQRRMYRVEKTYRISNELAKRVKSLKHKAYWLILTEHWCGDAAQILPVLNALAHLSEGKIEIKLVYRDENERLMDAFLTNGSRSIPKLIQLDGYLNVTGIWGPRPIAAQKLVKELKANPATEAIYADELHLWYAKNRQQELEKEISELLLKANLFYPDNLS